MKRTIKPIDHHFFVNHRPSLTPPHICCTADTPAPGHNFQSQSPGHEAFQRPRVEAAGRSSGPLICRGLGGDLENWALGWGWRLTRQKPKKLSIFVKFSEKKIDQRFRRPHGIGFPTVISTAFSQGKGSVMTIEGEQFGFFTGHFPKFKCR